MKLFNVLSFLLNNYLYFFKYDFMNFLISVLFLCLYMNGFISVECTYVDVNQINTVANSFAQRLLYISYFFLNKRFILLRLAYPS